MKYSREKPLSEADRDIARKRAKCRGETLYALTIVCKDEADQRSLFNKVTRQFPGRRTRVVVS